MSQAIIRPAPVRKSVTVAADPARAFKVFTADIGLWWPPTHTIGATPATSSVIEPGVGGRCYGIGEDGAQAHWGDVLVWSPPDQIVIAWRVTTQWTYDPDLTTEVDVRFTAVGEGRTRVDLEHRHLERLGEGAEQARATFESPNGWGKILDQYKAVVEAA
ncbi:SRPBCC family protein [Caulobacter sp. KR2-114]|uniref:SRPBCC family protein n=1 Tax=Caulobacter sp. KR2-114 TaxID=3400912 RepID=UPI003C0A86E9